MTAVAPRIATLAVIGVGLVGGSFALALKAAGHVGTVVGIGRGRANLDAALARGIVDRAVTLDADWTRELADADLVLLAAPVAHYPALFAALAGRLAPHAIITDAGSTKQNVIAAARAHLRDAIARFVPGHPIAGTEHTGANAAFATLYRDRNVVLTPLPETDAAAFAIVASTWAACGAKVCELDPAAHDRIFAAVSHLPHLLAFGLVDLFAGRPDARELFRYAASGYRDFTRIAAGSPEMWRDIALGNRDAILVELGAYRAQLDLIAAMVAAGDGAALEAVFARAAAARRAWDPSGSAAPAVPAEGPHERRRGAPRRELLPLGGKARSAKGAPISASVDAATGHLDLPPAARAEGVVALPGSKSISNRTLLLTALAVGDTTVRGLLDAEDVDRMREALTVLGIHIERIAGTREFLVHGQGGNIPVKSAQLFLGNAGTALRPLTAALAFAGGHFELSGVARMHERPIGDLVDALAVLGADVRYLGKPGFPPLAIGPGRTDSANLPDHVEVRGDVSSQFTTALLMALPLATARSRRAIAVGVAGELISKPYVAITINLMRRFGVGVEQEGWRSFRVPAAASYTSPGSIAVEGDASSASYFLAAGAIAGGPVRVTGVGRASIQGDIVFADVLARMGALIRTGDDWIEAASGRALDGITVDCVAIPDAAMTLAVVALFARGPTTLTGIASWRVKETDRIAAMAAELRKLGAQVDAGDDRLTVFPPEQLAAATIDTYDDHRIAMCFSLAALGGVAVRIVDPDCVRKTFPGYFAALRAIVKR